MSISLELGTTSATQVLRQKDTSIVLKINGYNYEFMSSCIFFKIFLGVGQSRVKPIKLTTCSEGE